MKYKHEEFIIGTEFEKGGAFVWAEANKFTGYIHVLRDNVGEIGLLTFRNGVVDCLSKNTPAISWSVGNTPRFVAFFKQGKFHNPNKSTPAVTWYKDDGTILSQWNYKNDILLGRVV